MNTINDINNIGTELFTEHGARNQSHGKFHPTTIAYVQTLVKPYAVGIEYNTTLEQIEKWVVSTFIGSTGNHINPLNSALNAMRDAVVNYDSNEDVTDKLTFVKHQDVALDATKLHLKVKDAIIRSLISCMLIVATEECANDANDSTVLPWDLQKGLGDNVDFSQMFGIPHGSNTLPVTIDGQHSIHTLEFIAGLLLFSHSSVGNRDFHVTMFGIPLESSYMVPPPDSEDTPRFHDDKRDIAPFFKYSMRVNDYQFGFETLDFIQGFIFGANQSKVEYDAYCTDLKEYIHNEQGTFFALQEMIVA